LTIAVLAVLSAYYLSSRVSGRLAHPLIALSHAATGISRGEFRQSVKVQADGEIGALVEAFNDMAARLDEATSKLAQTERVAAWRQVARRFAHELKNPLQPILVSLYRMEKQLADSDQWPQVKEPLRAAADEVKHLTELAERFSSLAKLPPPREENIDLTALVESVAELYREKLQPFEFQMDLPSDEVTVQADESYLREALHNLLQNAADACRPGDSIRLSVTIDDAGTAITVSDTGPGMDAETLAAARLPYFTTKEKGTGLGLAIIDKFIAELGGRFQVDSTPGQGTIARIVLPREDSDGR
jgi:two-component system nitrogen regulation sensor histidine kinase NtrY